MEDESEISGRIIGPDEDLESSCKPNGNKMSSANTIRQIKHDLKMHSQKMEQRIDYMMKLEMRLKEIDLEQKKQK